MLENFLMWLGAWIYFVVWFFAVAKYLHMKKDGTYDEVPKLFQWSLFLGLVPGLILDVIFNATYGTIWFRELPKEWTFSQRVDRLLDEARKGSRQHDRALWWADVLNNIDPGHV